MIYLDYAAGTPVDSEVLNTYNDTIKNYYANPNSNHKLGLISKNIIDQSTESIANNLKVLPEEIIYTSGASESNNLVVKGICERYKNRGKHILISALEHNSLVAAATDMQEKGFEVGLIPITNEGLVDLEALKSLLRDDTILVSVCTVDSELGLRQPVEEIAELLKSYPNCAFHTDASQSIGKIDFDLKDIDLVTITPHKFYGLPGTGILIKKKSVSLKPQINGGKSTTVYRSGTPCTADITSTVKALDIALKNQDERNKYITELSTKIKEELKTYPKVVINNRASSIPHTINFSIKGVRALDIQKRLEEEKIYVSTKTSCCPIETPSKLVYAVTKDKNLSLSSVRLSLSHLTTPEEVNTFLETFAKIYKEYELNGKI